MSEVKLPYYPKQIAILSESPFGVPELDCHKIYDSPLPNKIIYRIDMLEAVRTILGNEALFYRDQVYKLISGHVSDYGKCMQSFYNKFPAFREFVNSEYYYGERSIPITTRIKSGLHASINDRVQEINSICQASGGKYLVYTHCYLYFAFNLVCKVPACEGGIVIC